MPLSGHNRTKLSRSEAKRHLSMHKAKKILSDGEVRGHKLTKKQRGLFGAIASGQKLRK